MKPLLRVVLSVVLPWLTGVARLRTRPGLCDLAWTARMARWARRPWLSLRARLRDAMAERRERVEGVDSKLRMELCEVRFCCQATPGASNGKSRAGSQWDSRQIVGSLRRHHLKLQQQQRRPRLTPRRTRCCTAIAAQHSQWRQLSAPCLHGKPSNAASSPPPFPPSASSSSDNQHCKEQLSRQRQPEHFFLHYHRE